MLDLLSALWDWIGPVWGTLIGAVLIAGLLSYSAGAARMEKAIDYASNDKKDSFEAIKSELQSSEWQDRYRAWLQRVLLRVGGLIGDADQGPEASPPPAWTKRAFFFVLGLAVIYPVVFLITGWVGGGTGAIGGLTVLDDAPGWRRVLNLLAFVGVVTAAVYGSRTLDRKQYLRAFLAIAVAFSSVFAVAGPIAGAGAIPVAFAFAFAGARAVANAIAFVFAFAFAIALAGGLAGAIPVALAGAFAAVVAFSGGFALAFAFAEVGAGKARAYHETWVIWGLLTLFLPGLFLGLFALDGAVGWIALTGDTPHLGGGTSSATAPIVLFLGLLPVVNALWDWVSLGLSRFLLTRIAWDTENRVFIDTFYAILDLIAAAVFLALMAFTIFTVLALAETLHRLGGASPVLDASALLAGFRANPFSADHAWLFLMVLTTLVPTALHFMGALASVVTSWTSPLWRDGILSKMDEGLENADANLGARRLYGVSRATSWVLAGAVMLACVWILAEGLQFIGVDFAVEAFFDLTEAAVSAIESWDGSPLFWWM